MHRVDVGEESVEVDIDMRQQVDLVDDHQLTRAEHQRIFECLVFAFSDGRDHHPMIFADAKLGGTDEIADVFDHEQIELRERQRRQRRSDHVRVEMTLAAEARVGIDLHERDVKHREALRVVVPLNVAFDDADARRLVGVRIEPCEGSLEQRRFAGTGRTHQVDDRHLRAVEILSVRVGDRVVCVEGIFDDANTLQMHAASRVLGYMLFMRK